LQEQQNQKENRKTEFPPYAWLGVGVALGAGIGVAMDNIAIGAGIGVAIGAAMAATHQLLNKKKSTE
jgi:hypothetical protein